MGTIAFTRLGVMASPMAVNLARAGHEVVGYNRSPARAADLVDAAYDRTASAFTNAVVDADNL